MAKITLRPARPADCALILRFVRELADYEKLLSHVVSTEADMHAALFGPAPKLFGAIAESDGESAGFAVWYLTFSTFRGRHGVYVEDLYVRPAFRGHGIGRSLLAHIAARCVAEGGARLELSVLDWNAPAIGFYKALGAKPRKGWTIQQVEDAALVSLANSAPR
jgi:ribosomal protein S18 acetylase RimI-like enzyme